MYMADNPDILFLYGNDEYGISQRVRESAAVFSDDPQTEVNTAHLDARTMTEDEWVSASTAMPFLAQQRLVLLANPSARYADAQEREKFFDFLLRLPQTTKLIIWEHVELKAWGTKAEHEKQDLKHWLVKWVKQHGLGLERHALPPAREIPGWIIQYGRTQGGQIDDGAAERLAQMVGTDTRQAAQEITKLLTYVNWSRPVTATDVETLSPLTAAPDVFAMVDALAARNGRTAQRLLHRLLEAQDAFSTWGMIVRQFRLLLLAREVLDGGGGEAQASKALGSPPFVARKVLGQARGFTIQRLEQIYHRLLEIDLAAKTGRMPLDLAMDVLVVEVAA
jgi:DNA polymerase-3 subunit delta